MFHPTAQACEHASPSSHSRQPSYISSAKFLPRGEPMELLLADLGLWVFLDQDGCSKQDILLARESG